MGLKEDLKNVKVSELNYRKAVTISPAATVREAVVAMRNAGLGCIIAVDDEEKAVGMFSEGMLRHGLNESPGFLDETVESQMVARLPWVLPTDPAAEVLEAMGEFNLRFIAVLDESRRVLGIAGQRTIVEFIAEYFPHEVLTQDPTGVSVSQQREGA